MQEESPKVLARGGKVIFHSYDENHNQIEKSEKIDENKYLKTSYKYDKIGRVLEENKGGSISCYSYNENQSKPKEVTTPEGDRISSRYDKAGRRLSVKNSYGEVKFGHNRRNFTVSKTDGEGNESIQLYDYLGKAAVYYTPKAVKKEIEPWRYKYDFMSRQVETVTPEGVHHRIIRDGEGNILKEIHPKAFETGSIEDEGISYDYNQNGNAIRKHYPTGETERTFYDSMGNIIKQVSVVLVYKYGQQKAKDL
jgi:hypothetical protein